MKKQLSTLTAAALALLVSAPVVRADTSTGGGDSQFLQIFHAHIWDVTADGGDSTFTGLGHAICTSLANHYGDRSSIQQKLANKWKDETDAAWAITASAVAYCPEYVVSSDRW